MIRLFFSQPQFEASTFGAGHTSYTGLAGKAKRAKKARQVKPSRTGIRKPVAGEALIDSDGVVWLVESVWTPDETVGYMLDISRVTKILLPKGEAQEQRLSRAEFEQFCRNKGIAMPPRSRDTQPA